MKNQEIWQDEFLDWQVYCGADSVLDALFLSDGMRLSDDTYDYLMRIYEFIEMRIDKESKCVRHETEKSEFGSNFATLFNEFHSDTDSIAMKPNSN